MKTRRRYTKPEKVTGTIYFDRSSKGKGVCRNQWCAEITLAGVRLRSHSSDASELERWIEAVREEFLKEIESDLFARDYELTNLKMKTLRPKFMKL